MYACEFGIAAAIYLIAIRDVGLIALITFTAVLVIGKLLFNRKVDRMDERDKQMAEKKDHDNYKY